MVTTSENINNERMNKYKEILSINANKIKDFDMSENFKIKKTFAL